MKKVELSLQPGDRVKVLGLPRSKRVLATVLYAYPRVEELRLVRIQRDGICCAETFHRKFLLKLEDSPSGAAAKEGK